MALEDLLPFDLELNILDIQQKRAEIRGWLTTVARISGSNGLMKYLESEMFLVPGTWE